MRQMDSTPLWTSILFPPDRSKSSIIRRHCRNRVQASFNRHLIAAGYGLDGRALQSVTGLPNIFGSVRLLIFPTILDATSAEVDHHCGILVNHMLQHMRSKSISEKLV